MTNRGLPEKFISCDWGTSNFRLRLVDTLSLKVLSEHRTNFGIKKCHRLFKQQKELSQQAFFADYMLAQLEKLDFNSEGNYPLVASGMLSSSIGMQELDYCKMPIAFTGEDLISSSIVLGRSEPSFDFRGPHRYRCNARGGNPGHWTFGPPAQEWKGDAFTARNPQ